MKPDMKSKGRLRKRLVLPHELYVRSMYVADSNKYRMRRRGDGGGERSELIDISAQASTPITAPEERGNARATGRKYAVKERGRENAPYVKQRA